MSSNTFGGSDSNRRGGYQDKRGRGQGQHYTKGQDDSRKYAQGSQYNQGPPTAQQQQIQYVKKNARRDKDVQQEAHQENYEEHQHDAKEDEGGLTAAQKFDQLFGGAGMDMMRGSKPEEKKTHQHEEPSESNKKSSSQPNIIVEYPKKNPNRIRYEKDFILLRFKQQNEIDMTKFSKDSLKWIDLFNSSSLTPENVINQESAQLEASQMQTQKRGPGGKGQTRATNWKGQPSRGMLGQNIEDEEEEEDPEWVEFDPKITVGSFFGRAIPNETELRDNVKKEKERGLQAWGGSVRKTLNQGEDEFERLVKQEREEAMKKAALDKDLEQKVEVLAKDIERNERNYSDIDAIYEKNAKQKARQKGSNLDDDQLESLFNSLMEEEQKKKVVAPSDQQKVSQNYGQPIQQTQQPAAPVQQQQKAQETVQQQEPPKETTAKSLLPIPIQLEQRKKPKFTALQNVQNLFSNLPVVTHEKHRIKMDEIAKIDTQEAIKNGQLFKHLMQSINPFASFIIDECLQQGQSRAFNDKVWTLEESIFSKPTGEVNPENLKKTSSEMFVIYKYFSDPLIKVKSAKYTNDEFVQIKELFPKLNLLQTSPLNVQLQNLQGPPMMHIPQQPFMPQGAGFRPPQPIQPGQMTQQQLAENKQNIDSNIQHQQQQQQQQPNQQNQMIGKEFSQKQGQQQEAVDLDKALEDDDDEEDDYEEESQNYGGQRSGNDLVSMESQLKNLLGFQPR